MIIDSDFRPPWYLRNPHLQTLLANLVRPPYPEVRRERFVLSDGDHLTLAHGTATGPERVLILHGLEGSLHSSYARRILNHCNEHRIPATLMHFRGCDGAVNARARSYHSGDTGDLIEVIAYLKQQGSKSLALLGYSLGGNVTLKYMGEGQADAGIVCAAAVSVPLNLDVCAARMDRGFSRIYQYELLKRLRQKVTQKRQLLATAGFDPAAPARNFVEFDDAFTAPLHGFDNSLDYYRRCSSRQFLQAIDKPTLILHARDDPFMTEEVIPAEHELSACVTLELAHQGGHVGFIQQGILRQSNWLEPRIHRWLKQHLLVASTGT